MSQTILKPARKPTVSVLTSPSWTLTNNSGVDIVVIDAYASDSKSVLQFYEQSLTMLKPDGDGAVALKNGATQSVPLPDVHRDETGQPLDYTLILVSARTLFPIKVVTLSVQDEPPSFTGANVMANDVAATKNADKFYKVVQAYPSSNLATDYVAALNTGDEATIQAFFSRQEDYKDVTLENLAAIRTYYSRFPFAWVDYATSKTLYLYTSDGTDSHFVGSVAFTSQTTAPNSIQEATDGFSAQYVTSDGADFTQLSYVDGQFVDDVNAAKPAYCLRGLFTLRSDMTSATTDNSFMPVLKGTVNGQDVFSYDQKQSRSTDGLFDGIDVLHHPDDTQRWIHLLELLLVSGAVIGAAVALVVAIYKAGKTKPMTEEERKTFDNNERTRCRAILEKAGLSEGSIAYILDGNESLRAVRQAADERLYEAAVNKAKDAFWKQREVVDKLADVMSNDGLNTVIDNLNEIQATIVDPEPGVKFSLEDVMPKLNYNAPRLEKAAVDYASALGQEKRLIDLVNKESRDAIAILNTHETAREEIRSGELQDRLTDLFDMF